MSTSRVQIGLNQQGQTLVDLVVALALLSMSVASAGALSTATSRVNIEAGQRSQATALADREIEALRIVRSNFESSASLWTSYAPADGTCTDYIMTRAGDNWSAQVTTTGSIPYTQANSGESAVWASQFSSFSRVLHVCGRTIGTADHLATVTAKVTWQTAKTTDSVTSQTMLTDWKQ